MAPIEKKNTGTARGEREKNDSEAEDVLELRIVEFKERENLGHKIWEMTPGLSFPSPSLFRALWNLSFFSLPKGFFPRPGQVEDAISKHIKFFLTEKTA